MATTVSEKSPDNARPAKPVKSTMSLAGTKRAVKPRELAVTVGVSAILHGVLLIVLWFMVFDSKSLQEILQTITAVENISDTPLADTSVMETADLQPTNVDTPTENVTTDVAVNTAPDIPNINDLDPATVMSSSDSGAAGAMSNVKIGSALAGRSGPAKEAMLRSGGGNTASELAVATGLKWLAAHQSSDGSWSFDHSEIKGCDCKNPGNLKSCRQGATAMAMLAYMGGGHTHKKGDYQPQMKKAVDFMIKSQRITAQGGDYRGSSPKNAIEEMYAQGIVTIALCEAAALTKDERLKAPAFNAVKFIINAQGKDGGWRYQPNASQGDTSVAAWQIMALKSAQMSKLKIPPQTFRGAEKFLELVARDKGARYTYTPDQENPTTSMTAAALLCRIYMGWDQDKAPLKEGVAFLDKAKPARNDMYYNYYATQVMHHWGGAEWQRWNAVMRDQLVNTQQKGGHAAGSWNPADNHGAQGGRHYMTCLAVMTLEVYYRHLPIYQREHVKVEF